MKCLIIEDEPAAIDVLKSYINRTPDLQLIDSFREPLKALSFLRDNSVDLLFLDVNMPDLSGMELLNIISDPPLVVFTTAYSEYAIESYEKNALDYLLKPIDFQRFLKTIEKAQERLSMKHAKPFTSTTGEVEKSENVVYLKSGTQTHRVNLNEVRFLEKEGHYILFHLPDKRIMVRLSMSEVFELLSTDEFIQVHKSFVVAKRFVQTIEVHQLKIEQHTIPIGKTFRKTVGNAFGML